ncbi:ABC transporter permease [Candidatus Saganbacteria bacterium]|nr:ABC transporter permease [Candidatus Saganbacteria bacterium]
MTFFIYESLKQALRALASNKVRSFLTMLGVVIGIFSVITLVTIGEGAKSYITDQIQNLGAGYDSFIITAGKDNASPPNPKFLYSDINYLKSRIPEIKDIVPFNPASGDIYYGKKKYKAPLILGTTPNVSELMSRKIQSGRYFTWAEVDSRRKVALIGPKIARQIFGEATPLGEKIKIRGNNYLIIGITYAVGSIGPMDMDRRVIVPITTAQNMMGTNNILRFNIFPKDIKKLDEVQEKVRLAFIKRLGNDDFRFITSKGLLNIVDGILNALTGFVAGIAAISLVVGGIGIMNIMLVAVNERVREIGIRKAIGAKNRNIVLQFLVESMLISFIGGIIGILLGITGAFLIMYFIKGTLVIAYWAIILATTVSAIVGIFFGVYPAVRAARLDPVVALRYE